MKSNVLFAIMASIILMCLSLIYYFYRMIQIDLHSYNVDKPYICMRIQQDSTPFKTDIKNYQDMYTALKNSETYTYIDLYEQPLDILQQFEKFNDNDILQNSSEYQRVKTIQISENVQEVFKFTILEGRLLETSDFLYDGQKDIPVLLGYKYFGRFDLGDSFTADYLSDMYNFRVVGFLNENSTIATSLNNLFLDDCVVMPSFDINAQVPVTEGVKIHYANKTSGLIRTLSDDYQIAYDQVLTIVNSSNAGNYSINPGLVSVGFKERFGLDMQFVFYSLIVMFFILSALTILFFIKSKKLFSVNSFKTLLPPLVAVLILTNIIYILQIVCCNLLLRIPIRFFAVKCLLIIFSINFFIIVVSGLKMIYYRRKLIQ